MEAPPSGARKAVHDGGFLVSLAGLLIFVLGVESSAVTAPVIGVLLVLVGAVMVWLGSRRPKTPVPATVPRAA